MADLNTIAGTLAARLAGATELEKSKVDSLRFGLELILGAIIKGIVLFSLAYLLNVLLHIIIGLASAGLFRMLTGGAHCTGYSRCLTFGVIVYLAVGRLAVGLEYHLTPGLLIKLACLAVFFATLCTVKWAPAEVPYRPINGKQEKVLFKTLSLLYLAVWLLVLIYFINLLSNSLWMAAVLCLLVQVFSFTPPGYKFISWIDGLMIKLKIGGELDCG